MVKMVNILSYIANRENKIVFLEKLLPNHWFIFQIYLYIVSRIVISKIFLKNIFQPEHHDLEI